MDENNLLAGDFVLGVVNLFAEGQNRKKLVAAGNAAEGGDAERTPEGSAKTFGQFRGDALEFNVAADGAVGREQAGEWSGARMETIGTLRATPRHVAKDTDEVVGKSSSAGPATFSRITNWENHWGRTHLDWKRPGVMLWEITSLSKTESLCDAKNIPGVR